MRCVGRAAVRRTAAPTPPPIPSRARTAFGVRLMSAPTRENPGACSYTSTSWPAARSAIAAARPPTPPPQIPIFTLYSCPGVTGDRVIPRRAYAGLGDDMITAVSSIADEFVGQIVLDGLRVLDVPELLEHLCGRLGQIHIDPAGRVILCARPHDQRQHHRELRFGLLPVVVGV